MNEHVSKAVLGRYRVNPESVDDRRYVEEHLGSCAECEQLLEDMRAVEEGLGDPDSWVAFVDDPRVAALKCLAEIGPTEDAEAESLLADFDNASAARFAWEDLPNDVRFHTGGAVRALCKRANGMCERDPRYALALAKAAGRIADLLPAGRYPAKALHEWRGQAHKECANALYRLGQFPKTLEALDAAEAEFGQLGHVGIGQVAILYVRALVLYAQDHLRRAEELTELSANAALHLGDKDRFMRARHLQGDIQFERQDFRGAAAIFEDILRYGKEIGSSIWIARESLTLGNCHIELRNLRDARRLLDEALRCFMQLGFDAEVTRTRWAFARLVFAESATSDGIERMWSTVAELTKLEMLIDAAIAAVDLAEMLFTTNRARQIPKLLDGVVETFTKAGKLTGALSALAYVKEATAAGKLTKRVARDVQRFLSRTEYQPQLIFVPPPPEV
ncbi:MAG: hypothetical protein AABO58_13120 [Acidobacteriota bacterium]